MTKRRKQWAIACGALLVIIGLTASLVYGPRISEAEPPIEYWGSYSDTRSTTLSEIRSLEEDLKSTIVPSVDFSDVPLGECLSYLERQFEILGAKPVKLNLAVSDSSNVPITLKLTNVPLAEALRYTTSLAQLKYEVNSGREIRIVTLDSEPRTESGYFHYPFSFDTEDFEGEGPFDFREKLESAGISFREGDEAEFYPEKQLLWASTTIDQLELIDAYTAGAFHCYYEPHWSDPFIHVYLAVKEFFFPTPVTPPSFSPLPDPFGEPDPFGGALP